MAMSWRPLIPELLATGDYRTQGELVRALSERGHRVDQATVSRELRALGVTKVDGIYRLPGPPDVGAPIHRFAITAAGCLVVVITEPAFAMVVGQAIDSAAIPGVIGTVAGDDTVFVATEGRRATDALARFLGVRADDARAGRRSADDSAGRRTA